MKKGVSVAVLFVILSLIPASIANHPPFPPQNDGTPAVIDDTYWKEFGAWGQGVMMTTGFGIGHEDRIGGTKLVNFCSLTTARSDEYPCLPGAFGNDPLVNNNEGGCYVSAIEESSSGTYSASLAVAEEGTVIHQDVRTDAPIFWKAGPVSHPSGVFRDGTDHRDHSSLYLIAAGGNFQLQGDERIQGSSAPSDEEVDATGELLCYDKEWIICDGVGYYGRDAVSTSDWINPLSYLNRVPVIISTGPAAGEYVCGRDGSWRTRDEIPAPTNLCTTNTDCNSVGVCAGGICTCNDGLCINTRMSCNTDHACPLGLQCSAETNGLCFWDEDKDGYNAVDLFTGMTNDCADDVDADPDTIICPATAGECSSSPAYAACAICRNPGTMEIIGDGIDNNCDGLEDESLADFDMDGDKWASTLGSYGVDATGTIADVNAHIPNPADQFRSTTGTSGGEIWDDCADRIEDLDVLGIDSAARMIARQAWGVAGDEQLLDSINPGIREGEIPQSCDGMDNDCDEEVDEGCDGDTNKLYCESVLNKKWVAEQPTGEGGFGCCGDDFPERLENFALGDAGTAYAACLNSDPLAEGESGGRNILIPSLWSDYTSSSPTCTSATPGACYTEFPLGSTISLPIDIPEYMRGELLTFAADVYAASADPSYTGRIEVFMVAGAGTEEIADVQLPLTRTLYQPVKLSFILLYSGASGVLLRVVHTNPATVRLQNMRIFVQEESNLLYTAGSFYACTAPSEDPAFIEGLKTTTNQGIDRSPSQRLVPRENMKDECDVVSQWYCSASNGGTAGSWELNSVTLDGDTVDGVDRNTKKYLPASESDLPLILGNDAGCCPKNYCWDGTACSPPDEQSPSRETGINLLNNRHYVCGLDAEGSGIWTFAIDKKDQYGNAGGVCARNQCYYDLGAPEADQCVRNGFSPAPGSIDPDLYCNHGAWTRRTQLLAKQLLKAKNIGKAYTLACGAPEDVLLDTTGTVLAGAAQDFLTGCDGGDCVTNICILKSKDSIIIGAPLNNPLDASIESSPSQFEKSFLNLFDKEEIKYSLVSDVSGDQHHMYCDNVARAADVQQFRPCHLDDDETTVWYNPQTATIIFSPNDVDFRPECHGVISCAILLLGYGLEADKVKEDMEFVAKGFTRNGYLSRNEEKTVHGLAATPALPGRITVEYINLDINLCNAMTGVSGVACLPYAVDDDTWKFVVEADYTPELWADLALKTRLKGTMWYPSVGTRTSLDDIPFSDSRSTTVVDGSGTRPSGSGGTGPAVGGLPTGRAAADMTGALSLTPLHIEAFDQESMLAHAAIPEIDRGENIIAYTVDFGDGTMKSAVEADSLRDISHTYTLSEGTNEKTFTMTIRILKQDEDTFDISTGGTIDVHVQRRPGDIDHDGDGQTPNAGDCNDGVIVDRPPSISQLLPFDGQILSRKQIEITYRVADDNDARVACQLFSTFQNTLADGSHLRATGDLQRVPTGENRMIVDAFRDGTHQWYLQCSDSRFLLGSSRGDTRTVIITETDRTGGGTGPSLATGTGHAIQSLADITGAATVEIDPTQQSSHSLEWCTDGVDNDCDEIIDEHTDANPCYEPPRHGEITDEWEDGTASPGS